MTDKTADLIARARNFNSVSFRCMSFRDVRLLIRELANALEAAVAPPPADDTTAVVAEIAKSEARRRIDEADTLDKARGIARGFLSSFDTMIDTIARQKEFIAHNAAAPPRPAPPTVEEIAVELCSAMIGFTGYSMVSYDQGKPTMKATFELPFTEAARTVLAMPALVAAFAKQEPK